MRDRRLPPLASAPGDPVKWPVDRLTPHHESLLVFGAPKDSARYPKMLASVRRNGILEPLVARADGTLLSGHLRLACAREIGLATVPVRVMPLFADPCEELAYVIRSNSDQRPLTKRAIGFGFKRLTEVSREQDTLPRQRGPRLRAGVSRSHARGCEIVFTTPGVPVAFKEAVLRRQVATRVAARAIAEELKRQGGVLRDLHFLLALVPPNGVARHQRVPAEEASDPSLDSRPSSPYGVCRTLDTTASETPLAGAVSATQHPEPRTRLLEINLRAGRETPGVESPRIIRKVSLTIDTGHSS